MSNTQTATRTRVSSVERAVFTLTALTLLCVLALLSSCAQKSEVSALEDEQHLAEDARMSVMPHYSPDGLWVAFSYKPEDGEKQHLRLGVVAAEGGDIRTVYQDSLAALVIGWRPDSRAIYTLSLPDLRLREIDLEGRILATQEMGALSRPVDVSPDGKQLLVHRFNGDNYDMGLLNWTGTGEVRLVEESDTWEMDGCFGPGKNEITLVRQASHRSPTSEVIIRSLRDGQERVVPLAAGKHSSPAWSPDGRYLCYTSDASGNEDVWLYDTADGRDIRVTASVENETEADWSPDGEAITYTRHSRTSHIVLTDGESRSQRALTDDEGVDVWPSMSPDGHWVVFVRRPLAAGSLPSDPSLCLVSADGGDVVTLDLDGLRISSEETVMSWSSDSREIAFSAEDATGNLDVYVISREGGTPRRVTITPGMDMAPVWSPDGKSIGFTRVAGGETQVWVIPATGGLARQISSGDQLTQMAVWSKDSQKLAYQVMTNENQHEIWVCDVEGRFPPIRIAQSTNLLLWPVAWSRDGQEVLVFRVQDDRSILTAIRVADSREKELGVIDDGDLFSFGVRWNEAGAAYRDLVYRNGHYVTTDGDAEAEIVTVRVAGLMQASLQAANLTGEHP